MTFLEVSWAPLTVAVNWVLIHDRVRALELFNFEFFLEMYKPKGKRRWGYFALPVLHHDALVGKVDAAADRNTSLLQVHAVHRDVLFTRDMTATVQPLA